MFGNIGFPELLIIFIIALLVFGPKKLPEVGRSIGKALREFRRTSDEIRDRIEEEIQADEFKEIKKDIDEIKEDFNDLTDIENPLYPSEDKPDTKPASKAKPEKPKKPKEKTKDEEGNNVS